MTKRHFVELADMVREQRPILEGDWPEAKERFAGRLDVWKDMRDALADFCKRQNSNFNRERWMDYIAGECGPNGGKVKAA